MIFLIILVPDQYPLWKRVENEILKIDFDKFGKISKFHKNPISMIFSVLLIVPLSSPEVKDG